jgi:hypothetical protein
MGSLQIKQLYEKHIINMLSSSDLFPMHEQKCLQSKRNSDRKGSSHH